MVFLKFWNSALKPIFRPIYRNNITKKSLSEAGFEPAPPNVDQNTKDVYAAQGNLESGALHHGQKFEKMNKKIGKDRFLTDLPGLAGVQILTDH